MIIRDRTRLIGSLRFAGKPGYYWYPGFLIWLIFSFPGRSFPISNEYGHQSGDSWGKVVDFEEGVVRVFLGEYQHSLDAKGRLTIPAKFREELGEGAVITRGLDNCLFLFPNTEWTILETKLKTLPLTKNDARQFVRFLFSGATECELDKQGRIMLPANLREFAGIDKDAVVIGVSSRIEIWSREKWATYVQAAEESFDQIAENIVDLGI